MVLALLLVSTRLIFSCKASNGATDITVASTIKRAKTSLIDIQVYRWFGERALLFIPLFRHFKILTYASQDEILIVGYKRLNVCLIPRYTFSSHKSKKNVSIVFFSYTVSFGIFLFNMITQS